MASREDNRSKRSKGHLSKQLPKGSSHAKFASSSNSNQKTSSSSRVGKSSGLIKSSQKSSLTKTTTAKSTIKRPGSSNLKVKVNAGKSKSTLKANKKVSTGAMIVSKSILSRKSVAKTKGKSTTRQKKHVSSKTSTNSTKSSGRNAVTLGKTANKSSQVKTSMTSTVSRNKSNIANKMQLNKVQKIIKVPVVKETVSKALLGKHKKSTSSIKSGEQACKCSKSKVKHLTNINRKAVASSVSCEGKQSSRSQQPEKKVKSTEVILPGDSAKSRPLQPKALLPVEDLLNAKESTKQIIVTLPDAKKTKEVTLDSTVEKVAKEVLEEDQEWEYVYQEVECIPKDNEKDGDLLNTKREEIKPLVDGNMTPVPIQVVKSDPMCVVIKTVSPMQPIEQVPIIGRIEEVSKSVQATELCKAPPPKQSKSASLEVDGSSNISSFSSTPASVLSSVNSGVEFESKGKQQAQVQTNTEQCEIGKIAISSAALVEMSYSGKVEKQQDQKQQAKSHESNEKSIPLDHKDKQASQQTSPSVTHHSSVQLTSTELDHYINFKSPITEKDKATRLSAIMGASCSTTSECPLEVSQNADSSKQQEQSSKSKSPMLSKDVSCNASFTNLLPLTRSPDSSNGPPPATEETNLDSPKSN